MPRATGRSISTTNISLVRSVKQWRDNRPMAVSQLDPARFSFRLWAMFWLIVSLQAMDLATTYMALAAGAREGNPVLSGLLFTPAAPLFKAFAVVFLAILVVHSTTRGRPAPARLLVATRIIVLVYFAIVVNNTLLALRLP